MKKVFLLTLVCLGAVVGRPVRGQQASAQPEFLQKYAQEVKKWEKHIQQFEALDKQVDYPRDAVLFMGSSSIRIWKTIAEDMKPYVPIQRGFGGCKFSDVAWYVDRIVHPHDFQAVVMFVGNDVKGADNDKEPEELLPLVAHVVERIRAKNARAPIFIVEVTATRKRWHLWEKTKANNEAMKAYCNTEPGLYFVSSIRQVLGPDGKPNDALFQDDKLHLNEAGYKMWSTLIRTALDRVQAQ